MLPGVKIAMDIPRDQIVYEMLMKLNVTCDKIIFTTYVVSEVQINTCIAPPIHPTLWQKLRKQLGAPEHLSVRMRDARVVLLTRAGSYNAGRYMINYDVVVSYLHTRYGDTFHIFEGPYSLAKSIELFSNTRLMIGVHGGALYNMNFAPIDTHILEILPVLGWRYPCALHCSFHRLGDVTNAWTDILENPWAIRWRRMGWCDCSTFQTWKSSR